MENQFVSSNKLTPIFFGIIIFIILIIALQISYKNLNPVQIKNILPTGSALDKNIYTGILETKLNSQKTFFSKNEIIPIDIYGFSQNKNITGFDIVIKYDPKKIKYLSSKGILDNFVYVVKEDKKIGNLKITAFKKIDDTTSSAKLDETKLISLDFSGLVSGKHSLSMEYKKGESSDSNLITENNLDILGTVKNLYVEVK